MFHHTQGDVENIAGMDPKALTKLFEQISGYATPLHPHAG
jgi:chromosome segregation ATPase